MRRSFNYYVRKSHRYLGVVIGIQFMFWTVGGLYFSWTDIHAIRGEHLRSEPQAVDLSTSSIAPSEILRPHLAEGERADLTKLRIIAIFGEPYYLLPRTDATGEESPLIVRASDGSLRAPLTEEEATKVAVASLNGQLQADRAELIHRENVGGHHEYRGRPLPAWAVTFREPSGTTVYVGQADGQVHAVRTNSWRVFDFLWMLHTLDLYGRDDINNYLLRAFSIFGILSLLSGFLLFVITSRFLKKLR